MNCHNTATRFLNFILRVLYQFLEYSMKVCSFYTWLLKVSSQLRALSAACGHQRAAASCQEADGTAPTPTPTHLRKPALQCISYMHLFTARPVC